MQAAKAQLDLQPTTEVATALLEMTAALGGHMRLGKELNATSGLIASVVLASHVADPRPTVAAVAASGLQGASQCAACTAWALACQSAQTSSSCQVQLR